MYKIAVDIGGTNIKLAVINNELNIIDYKTIATCLLYTSPSPRDS